ncbi:hypothetical protein C8F01DRAFT_1176466 [Mycena amicta]|nr:hypothetical protein C8F01DRAFT_1176466 [Mycena amicta]
MHHALRVAEIVLEIAQHASDTTPPARKSLLALATTQRPPALWRELESIYPPLRCFPPGVFEFTQESEHKTTTSVSRAIRASDWARLRVKHLEFLGMNTIGGEDLHVLRHLTLSLPVATLFPHVATLDWRPDLGRNEETFQQMLLFLGPQLHQLIIHVEDARVLSPALRSVDMHQRRLVPFQNDGLSESISEFVVGLKRLQRLNVPSLTWSALVYLSELPAFETLTLGTLTTPPPPSAILSPGFSELCNPSCRGTNDLFRRLYSFANLSDVSLHIPAGFELDDTTIVELCRAWPSVTCLILSMDEPPSNAVAGGSLAFTPPMTLNALTSIAALCPALKLLTADIQVSIDPSVAVVDSRVIHTALRSLFVGFSPIAAIHPVAGFLSGLFPKARVSGYHLNIAFADKWKKVAAEIWRSEWGNIISTPNMPRLAKIREMERAWAAADSSGDSDGQY